MEKPKILTIKQKKLVGLKIRTSIAENKTRELWSRFIPKVKEIPNQMKSGLFSVQLFEEDLEFHQFTPHTFFEKWAAVEVASFDNIPENLEGYTLPAGKHAVFIHKGTPEMFQKTTQYIFGDWIPGSPFEVDNRPHFEVMDYDYRPDDPEAEEEVWVPIR